jgi:LacI family transcriptional regulator
MDQRCDYFCQFLRQAGFDCQVFVPRRGRRRLATWEHEQQQLADWLAHLPKPVGIMTCNDDRGQQLLDACRRAGVLVPDEVAVLGVDNDMVVCNLATPALSSIDVNPQRIGYAGAALLDRLMAGGRPPKKPIYLNFCSLVPRQSTDVLAIHDRELSTAVRFIREHACAGINVESILQVVSLSRSVLERRFKKVIGRTPKAEILSVQMQRAKQLLTETDLSLEEIARKTGFRTEKYFGDIFYRKAGLRAGAYRKRFRRLG